MASSLRAMAGEIALIESPAEFTLPQEYVSVVIVEGLKDLFSRIREDVIENIVKEFLGTTILGVNVSGVHLHRHLGNVMLFFPRFPQTVPYSVVITKVVIAVTKICASFGGAETLDQIVCYMSGFKTKAQLFVYSICKCYGMYLSYIKSISPEGCITTTDLNEKTLIEVTSILKDHGVDITSIPDAETYGTIYAYAKRREGRSKKLNQLPGLFDGRNERTYISFIFG